MKAVINIAEMMMIGPFENIKTASDFAQTLNRNDWAVMGIVDANDKELLQKALGSVDNIIATPPKKTKFIEVFKSRVMINSWSVGDDDSLLDTDITDYRLSESVPVTPGSSTKTLRDLPEETSYRFAFPFGYFLMVSFLGRSITFSTWRLRSK